MAVDAAGAVRHDFVQEAGVPGRAGGAAAGVGGAREHDFVGDCVAAFGEAGFGGAHFFLGGLLVVGGFLCFFFCYFFGFEGRLGEGWMGL